MWDTASGQLKKTIAAHSEIIVRVAFSPDGGHVATCSDDRSVALWSTGDWSLEKRLTDIPGYPSAVAFSPDGMKLAWICILLKRSGVSTYANNGQLTVWDIPSGQRNTLEAGEGSYFRNMLFSPDGKWLALDRDIFPTPQKIDHAETILWNVLAAREDHRLAWPSPIDWCYPSAFTADSATLLGSTRDGLAAWNISTDVEKMLDASVVPLAPDYPYTRLSTLRVLNTDDYNDIFPPGALLTHKDILLITNDWSGTVHIKKCRHLSTTPELQPVATCYTFEKGLWLIVTPQGYFDGSPEIAKVILWKQNGKVYPYDRFEKEYHRPDLVRKALQDEKD